MANITLSSKRIVDLPEAAYGKGAYSSIYGTSKGGGGGSMDMSPYALLEGRLNDILHIDEINRYSTDSLETGLIIEGTNFMDNVVTIDQIGTSAVAGGYLNFDGTVDIRDNDVKVFTVDDPTGGTIRIGEAGNDTMTGYQNILIGDSTGQAIAGGIGNLFMGYNAGVLTTSASFNVALGYEAMHYNQAGTGNFALGPYAMYTATLSNNIAIGNNTMRYSEGESNTYIGNYAGYGVDVSSPPSASFNVGIGYRALRLVEAGDYNVGIGFEALENVADGYGNISIGYDSGSLVTDGFYNIMIGYAVTAPVSTSYALRIGSLIEGSATPSSQYLASPYEFRTDIIEEYTTDAGITTTSWFYHGNPSDAESYLEIRDNGLLTFGFDNKSGGWARGMRWADTGTSFWNIGVFGSGQTATYYYNGVAYDDTALRVYPSSRVEISQSNGYYFDFDGQIDIRDDGVKSISFDDPVTGSVRLGKYTASDTMTGLHNVAIGYAALQTIGSSSTGYNTAIGGGALNKLAGGVGYNTAIGAFALGASTSGERNFALGGWSFEQSLTADYNVGLGLFTGRYNLGGRNFFAGYQAGYGNVDATSSTGSYNMGIGYASLILLEAGIGNIAIGYNTGTNYTDEDYNIILGYDMNGTASDDRHIRIGISNRSVIEGNTTSGSEWMGTAYEIRTDTLTEYTVSSGVTIDVDVLLTGILPDETETYLVAIDNSTGLLSKRLASGISGATYNFTGSIDEASNGDVSLDNDSASPGASKLYGTNSSSVKGWYDIPTSGTPTAHASTHEDGGADEISVADLSGLLADAQTPLAHGLESAYHTVSGLTTGHFMKALSATTYGFAAHGLTYTDVGAAATSHEHSWADITSGTQPDPVSHNHAWSDITSGVPANLTSLAGLTYVSLSFVKMSATGTFSLDTNTYLTSETSHADVLVDGDFTSEGLMKRGASAGSYSIVTDNSADWNTAYGWGDHDGLYEPDLGNPASDGYVLSSTVAGARSWVSQTGGMVYPGAGIALSTGSAWGTSITDASADWNTAFGWGDHSGLYVTGVTAGNTTITIGGTSQAPTVAINYNPNHFEIGPPSTNYFQAIFGTSAATIAEGDHSHSGVYQPVGDYFDLSSGGNDMDDIADGTTYVKTQNDFNDTLLSKLNGITDGADLYSSWTLHDDGGLADTITSGETLTITGGSYITAIWAANVLTIAYTGGVGTVTAVTGSAPITSTGGSTPEIGLDYEPLQFQLDAQDELSLIFGTGAGVAAEGNHDHSGTYQPVGNYFDTTTDTLDDITDGTTYVRSHNDFTDTLLSKLNGIADGADLYDNWILYDDGGLADQISSGQRLDIVGGTYITAVYSGNTLTITNTNTSVGTVTNVTGTNPITSTGGTTPAIGLAYESTQFQLDAQDELSLLFGTGAGVAAEGDHTHTSTNSC